MHYAYSFDVTLMLLIVLMDSLTTNRRVYPDLKQVEIQGVLEFLGQTVLAGCMSQDSHEDVTRMLPKEVTGKD